MPSESLSFRPEWKQLRLLPYLPSRGSLVANVVLIFEALSQVAKMERLLAPRVNPGCRIPPMQSLGNSCNMFSKISILLETSLAVLPMLVVRGADVV